MLTSLVAGPLGIAPQNSSKAWSEIFSTDRKSISSSYILCAWRREASYCVTRKKQAAAGLKMSGTGFSDVVAGTRIFCWWVLIRFFHLELHLAKHAQHNTSVIFVFVTHILCKACNLLSLTSFFFLTFRKSGSEAKSVLISAYDMIGETDCLHGCYSSSPLSSVHDRALLHVREMEGRWNEVLKTHDLVLSCSREAASHAVRCNFLAVYFLFWCTKWWYRSCCLHYFLFSNAWGGNSLVVECSSLDWKVGCWTHGPEWIAVALFGQERSLQTPRQEAKFSLWPATNCCHPKP